MALRSWQVSEDQPLLGSGRVYDVYADGPDQVVRVARDATPEAAADLAREAAVLDALRRLGLPTPAAYGTTSVEGRPAVILERIPGPDVLTRFGERPWLLPRLAAATGEAHAALLARAAPRIVEPLRDVARAVLASPLVPVHIASVALERLERLPDGDRLLHGDLHPGNVLLGPAGPVVIDWENVSSGPPAADLARTELLIRHAAVDDTSPLERVLIRFARRTYARRHRRAVELRIGRVADVEAWIPIVAAMRLAEGDERERPALLELAAPH
jgi:aminoglycoside phosphotransferase (APT) family kinase protein